MSKEPVDYKKMIRFFTALERALSCLNKEERIRVLKMLFIFNMDPSDKAEK